jgi:hypothetical protein
MTMMQGSGVRSACGGGGGAAGFTAILAILIPSGWLGLWNDDPGLKPLTMIDACGGTEFPPFQDNSFSVTV